MTLTLPTGQAKQSAGTVVSVPPTPLTRRPIHTDAVMLDAARGVFATGGYDGASMNAIATAAGVTKPTLYGRFGSKRGLYEQAVRRDADALVEHLFAAYSAVADAPVPVMVDASMGAYLAFFVAEPDAYGLLFASGRAEPAVAMADRVLDTVTDRLAEVVTAVLSRRGGSSARGARLLAAMLLGIAHHGTAVVLRDPDADAAQAQALATQLALSGLRGLPLGILAQPA
jgi:AcrR family transcriptional regulator